jgi:hypothetical protein
MRTPFCPRCGTYSEALRTAPAADAAITLMLAFHRQRHQELTAPRTDHDATELLPFRKFPPTARLPQAADTRSCRCAAPTRRLDEATLRNGYATSPNGRILIACRNPRPAVWKFSTDIATRREPFTYRPETSPSTPDQPP